MFGRFWQTLALSTVMLIHVSVGSSGGETQCEDCHARCACQKVCRLVREDKKVSIPCWGCQVEEFCLPGPSERGCLTCEKVCAECDPKVHTASKTFAWYHWIPGCPQSFATKKKLVKKTVTKTIPSFQWVIVDVCPDCRAKYVPPEIPAGEKLPPPPPVK